MPARSGNEIAEVGRSQILRPSEVVVSMFLYLILSLVETIGKFKSTRALTLISRILRRQPAVNPREGILLFRIWECNVYYLVSGFFFSSFKIQWINCCRGDLGSFLSKNFKITTEVDIEPPLLSILFLLWELVLFSLCLLSSNHCVFKEMRDCTFEVSSALSLCCFSVEFLLLAKQIFCNTSKAPTLQSPFFSSC